MMEVNVFFRALEPEDALFINRMRRIDKMTSLTGDAPRYVSLEREKKFVNDMILGDYQDRMYVAICEIGDEKIIGYASISDIDYFNSSCFWSGMKIDPEYAGKGYGFQVALLITKHAIENLGMQRCIGMCFENHYGVQKILKKAGYIQEGLQRNYLYKHGEYINMYLYSILKEEYSVIKEKYKL